MRRLTLLVSVVCAVAVVVGCGTRLPTQSPEARAAHREALDALSPPHAASTTQSVAIAHDAPLHLGLSLALTHAAEMQALRKAQLDPKRPEFRQWLTPLEFGERFGQSAEVVQGVRRWLEGAGLSVTVAPSRAFVEATGTAAQVESLLGIALLPVEGQPSTVHVPSGTVRLPEALKGVVVNISGLDTRVRFKRRLHMAAGPNAFGPQDLRRYYGLTALHQAGWVGQGQKLAVLAMAWRQGDGPSDTAIRYFLSDVSNTSALYVQRLLPNPQNDVAGFTGAGTEWSLDVEAQSVGVPGAESITLVVSPASEVFTTGANDIVNNLSDVTAVSISLGLCEAGEKQNQQVTGFDEMHALQNAVVQGLMEGQTWSAATGDNGADDCGNGTLAVDFPSTLPEIVAAGGSSLQAPAWDATDALQAYQQETTWNAGGRGGAAGGGISTVFAQPAYQQGISSSDAGRSVPDLSLMAGPPGVGVDDAVAGQLFPVQGTSVSSPLSAGFFALIASRVGCRLGDVHQTLYDLGQAQLDGGASVYHDITTGNLSYGGATGPAAGPGYDSATGWGSLDVSALAEAWPPCPAPMDGGLGPWDAGAPYDACETLGCDAGCTTLPSGPSTCAPSCDPQDAGACALGTVCSQSTLFATATTGTCVPGCNTDLDCFATADTVCSRCAQACVPQGSSTAQIGASCANDSQCPTGAYCSTSRQLNPNADGYCTQDCLTNQSPGDACACPAGSQCGTIGRFAAAHVCLASCTQIGASCRTGYICQTQALSGPACLPRCAIRSFGGQSFDTCQSMGSNDACDVDSGICGGPVDPVDAGDPDAGQPNTDAGTTDPVQLTAMGDSLGNAPTGCGCTAVDPSLFWGLSAVVAALARRRSAKR